MSLIGKPPEYITIFGVNEENLKYIDNIFSEYNPIYIGANYCDELIWNRALELYNKNDDMMLTESDPSINVNKVDSIQKEFRPTPIQFFDKSNRIEEAFLNSTGNWIYARFSSKHFELIQKDHVLQSKYVLKNDDNEPGNVIYCMRGIYQSKEGFSEIPKLENSSDKKLNKDENCIYKMSKIENLVDLSFEGKTFNLKFNEFIVGNYKINREEEIAKENTSGSREFILTVALIIFFAIFIYKVSQ